MNLAEPNFYIELDRERGYYIAARVRDNAQLARAFLLYGNGFMEIDAKAAARRDAEWAAQRRPFELRAQEWWLA